MLHTLNQLPHNAGLGVLVYYGLSGLISVVLLIAAARMSFRYPTSDGEAAQKATEKALGTAKKTVDDLLKDLFVGKEKQ